MTQLQRTPEPDENIAVLQRVAAELGARGIAEEAKALAERARAGLFFVACVGQFKRGKSTLLNGLLGERILPMGVVPITTAVTILRCGPQREAKVRFADGRSQNVPPEAIASFVSEEENPENEKGVRAVEVFLPNSLLSNGMCFVDTPGIGSVFSGNTAVTRDFVPHIDAALVVLGADPPISGDELALLRDVTQHVSHLLFVLNKADRLPGADRAQATKFTQKVLAKHLKRTIGHVFEISAVEPGLLDWYALKGALETLARDSGAALALQGSARQRGRLSQVLRLEIGEHRSALLRPVESSRARVGKLRSHVETGEQALGELSHLLNAEEERLTMVLERKRAAFLPEAQAAASTRLNEAFAEDVGTMGELRQHAFECAQDIAREILDAWRLEVQPLAEGLYRTAEERFVHLANELAHRLREAGEEVGASPELRAEATFRAKSGLYYTGLWSRTSASAFEWILNSLRTRRRARKAVARRVNSYLGELLVVNTSRIMYDLVDRTRESQRQLEAQVRRQIQETVARADRALARAEQAHSAGGKEVEAELAHLDELAATLPAE